MSDAKTKSETHKSQVPEWAQNGFAKRNISPDAAQAAALEALDPLIRSCLSGEKGGLFSKLKSRKKSGGNHGAYLYGPVGRGKTLITDILLETLIGHMRTKRQHFHEFMGAVHDFLHAYREAKTKNNGPDKALEAFAENVASETDFLVFDEFHVTNIADAMLLSRLFEALFEAKIKIVTTSNWEPDRLYEGGLQRARFLPFIEELKAAMTIVPLDGETDYRRKALHGRAVYFETHNASGMPPQMHELWDEFTDGGPYEAAEIKVKGRTLHAAQTAKGCAHFSFADLCEKPLGAEDYLKLAEKFDVIFLSVVPRFTYDRRNEGKRFMTLVDVLYDKGRALILAAQAAPDKLYHEDTHAFEFQRTASRLNEMQGQDYLKNALG